MAEPRSAIPLSVCALLAALALVACAGNAGPPAPADAGPKPAWKLTASRDSVDVHPGESRDVTFTLRDDADRPVAGEVLQFSVVDDPATPVNDAQGATLSFDRAVTNGRGEVVLQIIAGLKTVFQVSAVAPGSSGDAFMLLVFVESGTHGAVEVAPIVAPGDQIAATWSGSRVLFFDSTPCSKLTTTQQPASRRPPRTLAPGQSARFDAVATGAIHGALAYGLDEAGTVRFLGCVDVPGTTLLENETVRLPLPLAPARPTFAPTYHAVSQLQFAPPPAGAIEISAAWGELAGCPLDPAQLWLDCTIAALDDAPDAGAGTPSCEPRANPGPLATKLTARRGVPTAGSRCRATTDAAARPSVDALTAALFRSDPALAALPQVVQDAQHLTDIVKLRSTLTIAPAPMGASDGAMFRVDHVVDEVEFSLGTAFATVATAAYGAPLRSARATATTRGNDLVVERHGFALRIGTAARLAFLAKSLLPRTGQPDVDRFVRAVYGAARRAGPTPALECAALDETLCPVVGEPTGCLRSACAGGLARITARLDQSFQTLNGNDVDLLLAGPVPLIDRDGDGKIEALGRLGPDPARPGLWTGELRATAGIAPFSGIWLGVL